MDAEKAPPRNTRKKSPPNQCNVLKDLWYGWYGVPISEEDIKTALKPKKVILRVSLDHIRLCFPKEERFEGKFIFIFSLVLVRYPMLLLNNLYLIPELCR